MSESQFPKGEIHQPIPENPHPLSELTSAEILRELSSTSAATSTHIKEMLATPPRLSLLSALGLRANQF